MLKEYLAICSFNTGCGSFARAETKEKAVKDCQRIAVQDWHSIFDLHNKEVLINIYDITGIDNVFWDYRGVHPEKEPELTINRLDTVKVKLTVPKKYR